MIHQLTAGATIEEIKAAGFDGHYASNGIGLQLVDPSGTPWTSAYVDLKADPIADMSSNMGAEERARAGYEHLLDLTRDEDVRKVLSFLREREVVHFQRFGEALNHLHEFKDHDRYFFMNQE